MAKHVLSVGNCGFDHRALAQLLKREFGAEVTPAHSAADALAAAQDGDYALVLVNRIFDADGYEGLKFIRALKQDAQTLPVMLITNYDDHQAAAVAAGAEPGFGKSSLHEPETHTRLAKFLR